MKGHTPNDPTASRIRVPEHLESAPLEQITKQLFKLVEVVKISELDPRAAVERELLLVTVDAPIAKVYGQPVYRLLGGPCRDWLNAGLGYIKSAAARAKNHPTYARATAKKHAAATSWATPATSSPSPITSSPASLPRSQPPLEISSIRRRTASQSGTTSP